jgi:hypothetical protein
MFELIPLAVLLAVEPCSAAVQNWLGAAVSLLCPVLCFGRALHGPVAWACACHAWLTMLTKHLPHLGVQNSMHADRWHMLSECTTAVTRGHVAKQSTTVNISCQ